MNANEPANESAKEPANESANEQHGDGEQKGAAVQLGAPHTDSNPYASPSADAKPKLTYFSGPAWGLLFGPIHGATFGALAGLSLAAVATIFFAVTRLPGWFGPSEGMAIRLLLYFALAGMVGGVAGMSVGAVGGLVAGFIGRWCGHMLPRVGAFVFALLASCLTAATWGREMVQSESQWRLSGPIAAILIAALYGGAAGRRTGLAIQAMFQKLARAAR